jgi:hypothetical protein
MQAKVSAPRKKDVRDFVRKLVIETDDPEEQSALSEAFKEFSKTGNLHIVIKAGDLEI